MGQHILSILMASSFTSLPFSFTKAWTVESLKLLQMALAEMTAYCIPA